MKINYSLKMCIIGQLQEIGQLQGIGQLQEIGQPQGIAPT